MARLIRSFFQSVGLIQRGKVEEKLDTELSRVITALEEHPDDIASGSVTLTVTVKKMADRYEVVPKVDTKLPKEKPFNGAAFWVVDGALSVEHPSQADMFGPRDSFPVRQSETA